MPDYGVTDTGFTVKPYTAILEALQEKAKALMGADIDLTSTSPLQQLLQDTAAEMAALWEEVEDVYYAGFVQYSTGAALDEIARLVGMTRTPATAATTTATFARSTVAPQDYTIPEGTQVSTEDGVTFETTEIGVLETGQTEVDIPVQAIEVGTDGNVAAGTITALVSTVTGIETVTNDEAATGGTPAETDSALRYRVINYVPGAKATIGAIENALLSVDGVTDVNVAESLESHTITATVLGGDSDDLDAALLETRPAGIAASWQRPTEVEVTVTVTVATESGYQEATVEANIATALAAFFESLTIGDDITYSALVAAIMGAEGVQDITALEAEDDAGTPNVIDAFGETLTIADGEWAVEGTHSITAS